MKIGRAEIGIILIICTNLPFVGMPFIGSLFSYILWLLIADPNTIYSISGAITGISLILLISDKKGFLHRMRGNKLASILLVIFGLILIGESLIVIREGVCMWNYENTKVPENPMTLQESTTYFLFWAWAGLAAISGILWFLYGLMTWRYEGVLQSLKQENKQK